MATYTKDELPAGLTAETAETGDLFIMKDASSNSVVSMTRTNAMQMFTGDHLVLPADSNPATPTLAFGTSGADSGLYQRTSARVNVAIGGAAKWEFSGTFFGTSGGEGGAIMHGAPSGTSPNLVPVRDDPNTGIGSPGADQLTLITGGAERVTVDATGTVDVNKGTADEGFFNFKATIDGDATSAISSLTTTGAATHHIQIEINGTTAWIPCSTTDPS